MQMPPSIAFEDLYLLTRDTEIVEADCWSKNDWFIDFKRTLSAGEYERWLVLKEELLQFRFSDNKDVVIWELGFSSCVLLCHVRRLLVAGNPSKIGGC